jgi:predicted nicotinamide N-methyase
MMNSALLRQLAERRTVTEAETETQQSVVVEGDWVLRGETIRVVYLRRGALECRVELREQCSDIIGLSLWPSAIVLARYLLSSTHLQPSGLRVLELGAGCGLSAITFAELGNSVVATDKASVLPVLIDNVRPYPSVEVVAFDWFEFHSTSSSPPSPSPSPSLPAPLLGRGFDLVVLCDCLYSSASVAPLVTVLLALLREYPSLDILIANEERTALDEFLSLARRQGSSLPELVPVSINSRWLDITATHTVPVRVCRAVRQEKAEEKCAPKVAL